MMFRISFINPISSIRSASSKTTVLKKERFRTFRSIKSFSRPGVPITNSLRCFDIIWVLTNGGPGYATTPIVVDIYNNAFAQNRFGYGTAKAVLLCFIIIGITTIQLSVMKKKEIEY